MLSAVKDFYESFRYPNAKQVFFPALRTNRKIVLSYANRLVKPESKIENIEHLEAAERLRKQKKGVTFICNHLTYADSHVIEAMLIRSGFSRLAGHLIHIAGQKTFQLLRRPFTRSLNTIRVYQAKANVDILLKKKMNSRALKWAAHQQRRGFALLVFPEGTRSRLNGRFNLPHANPKTTLYFRNSLIVPMGLMGAEKILPLGKLNTRPAKVLLRIGKPIEHAQVAKELRLQHPDGSERQIRQTLIQYYMGQINDLLVSEYQYQPLAVES
jgi:1-acyl-sn-glycerol-3-phosphate acyltransferase